MSEPMQDVRARLGRVVSIINGKGGVGKTSIASNLSALLAQDGHRVLLLSLDPQDNIGEDLGYGHHDLGDDGSALVEAINGRPWSVPLQDIRTGLDVISGGDMLELLVADLYADRAEGIDRAWDLATALAQVAPDYDFVFIDCPPGYHVLQELALVASQWILVPTTSDSSSRKGINRLAQRVQAVEQYRDDIGLLGVVLFDLPPQATRVQRATIQGIHDDLGMQAPVFNSVIRTSRAAAHDGRDRGQLMHELAREVAAAKPFYEARDQLQEADRARQSLSRAATSVAADYANLKDEFLSVFQAQYAAEQVGE